MYLGVDGGGTKTALLLLDRSGNILARHEEASSYYIEVGIEGVRRALRHGIDAILRLSGRSIGELEFVFFGLPAHGEDSHNTRLLDRLPAEIVPPDRYRCGNDMVCGWAGSLGCRDGISVVAGTGSICYGEHAGRSARCGGWGELFSDEGSAYWIARCGLTLFSRMSDGRAAKGPLYDLFVRRLGLSRDIDLASKVFVEWRQERSKIAQLSKLVFEAALDGDAQALGIFTNAAQELAQLVDATRRSLEFPADAGVRVSYSGGVINAGSLVLRPFIASLQAAYNGYSITAPRFSPAAGAALYAAKCNGFEYSEAALRQLEQQDIDAIHPE